jgi:hypothetical protein
MAGHNAEPTGAATPDDSNSGSYQDFSPSQPQGGSVVNAALETALQMAELGYVVGQTYGMRKGRCSCGHVDCRTPGKHPVGGDTRATTDPEMLSRWWKDRPDAGLFVNLEKSGLVDVSSDSAETLLDFRKRGLPATVSFESGSGAGHEHHLYRLPAGTPRVRWCKSGVLDLMSGGIAVVPPSISGKGPYRWLTPPTGKRVNLPTAPAWVVEALHDHANREYEAAHIDRNEPPVRLTGSALEWWNGDRTSTKPEGGIDRSKTLVTIAHYLVSAGASAGTILEALENRDAELGLRCYTDRNDSDRRYAEIAAQAVENRDSVEGASPAEASEFRLLSASDLMNRPDPVWTVKGLLQANTTAAFVGPHGSYKSFAALGLAAAVALGREWLGFKVQKSGPVVYVVAEGADAFKLRLEALCREMQVEPADFDGKLYFLDHTLYVTDPMQVNKLLLAVESLGLKEPPVLVILDTLARTYGIGKKENLQEDMSEYVEGMDRLRIALDGSIVLTLHHNNAAGGMRGSTVLPGALSTIVGIASAEGQVTFRCDKQKDAEEFEEFVAMPHKVNLRPVDQSPFLMDPEPRNSVVLRRQAIRPNSMSGNLKPNERRLLQALKEEPSHTLSYSRWKSQTKIADSSLAAARNKLLKEDLVAIVQVAGKDHYHITEAGLEAPEGTSGKG